MRFWLKRGVKGFRVDAFPNILEDPRFLDEPEDPSFNGDPIADGYGLVGKGSMERRINLKSFCVCKISKVYALHFYIQVQCVTP